MKQLYTFLLSIFFLIVSVGELPGQDCPADFTVKATSTPSTCQSNGTVSVTLEGDIANLYNIQYSLTSSGSFTIPPQSNPVLANIPSGTYTVSVRAFCKNDASYNVVKTAANVVVGGNYKVPEVSFNATASRNSYESCNTGIIALNVSGGSGTYTFTIVSAPAGGTTGVVSSTQNGTLYTLAGANYPSGDYVVSVNDGCYTSVCYFTLGKVSGFPQFLYNNYYLFRPNLINNNCSSLYLEAGAVSMSNSDYRRYYEDGMYEVGLAPAGAVPTKWVVWTPANQTPDLLMDLSPYTYSNFYAANSLSVYTRLKGYVSVSTSITTNLASPIIGGSPERNLTNYIYDISSYNSYNGMFCYPLSVVVTKVSNGQVVFSKTGWSYKDPNPQVTLEYDTNYKVTVTGANGIAASTTVRETKPDFLYTGDREKNCEDYKITYSVYSGNTTWPVQISITDPSGQIVWTDTLTKAKNKGALSHAQYRKTYTVKGVFGIPASFTYTKDIMSTLSFPTSYNITTSTIAACGGDEPGRFSIRPRGGMDWIGTVFTITGPPGFKSHTYTLTEDDILPIYGISEPSLPAGTYTLTINNGCTPPVSYTVTHPGGYSGKALSYTKEKTCAGLKVTPSGIVTYQGNAMPSKTYYRLLKGPVGYDQTVKSPGGYFVFSKPGTYILGIQNDTSRSDICVLKTDTIQYTAPPMALSPNETNAYECAETATGVILLKAINGSAPYTYQLWNEDNTAKVGVPDVTSSDQVHFAYGQAGNTYTVRVTDQCGNNFSQKITLIKLGTAHIAYAANTHICNGDSIFLNCMTLGRTTYTWKGPNGFTSTKQNPKLGNAGANMSGWYTVTVQPEFCGAPVQDSIPITVYAPLTAGAVSPNQKLCVRYRAQPMSFSTTNGSGSPVYQWQSSTNGVSSWEDVAGATGATYIPPSSISSGRRYYRVQATDCGTVFSNVITIEYEPCCIPVNPHIQLRTGRR